MRASVQIILATAQPAALPREERNLCRHSRLALPRKGNGSLLNAAMNAKTEASNQDDATGVIRLNALRLKVAAKVQRKV